MQPTKAEKPFDVLIVGAGAAGLMAALELSAKGKTVAVVEALNRTGGRMFDAGGAAGGCPVAMGAEFVHGNLPLTLALLQRAGAALLPISGSLWHFQQGALNQQAGLIDGYDGLEEKFAAVKSDLPVAEFIHQYLQEPRFAQSRFSLQDYVEGYCAADMGRASTFALCEDLTQDDEPQYRIDGGYGRLVRYLEEQCRQRKVSFFLNQPVQQVQWQLGQVKIKTSGALLQGRKAVITVSVGVLQAGAIRFVPALPSQESAAHALGYGHAVKIILLFRQAFWKDPRFTSGNDLHDLQFLFSEESIPTWWSQHPENTHLLTGWLGGPKAEFLKSRTHDELLQLALDSLSRIFGLEKAYLWQDLLGAWSHNWSADPYFRGAYSYEVVAADAHRAVLQQPVADTLYFAGEGLHHGPEIGTVEAALKSGKEAAEKILSSPESLKSQ